MHLFCTYLDWHEGRLTIVRSKIENNEFLRTKGTQVNLPSFILSGQFNRRSWMPICYTNELLDGKAIESTFKSLSDKTIADCVEAIIGVCVESDSEGMNKEEMGLRCMKYFLSDEFQINWKAGYLPLILADYDKKGKQLSKDGKLKVMSDLANILGYKFQRPVIALEALTHASYSDPQWPCGCFQRLEFLGYSITSFNSLTM